MDVADRLELHEPTVRFRLAQREREIRRQQKQQQQQQQQQRGSGA